jgi:putative SOS response-associated peptidase YedK
MCYDSLSLTKRALDYANRIGYSPETIAELEEQFLRIRETQGPVFVASGYSHPTFPIIKNLVKAQVDLHHWGLIPHWVKDIEQAKDIWNRTLNARSESLLAKPSFKQAAQSSRCLVVTDGFFEHHHHRGKTYPYLVRHSNEDPMILGGIAEEWTDPHSGKSWKSFSIVTTQGNELLSKIHNNPKMKGPRIPIILDKIAQKRWLDDWGENAEEQLKILSNPYPSSDLKAHPVASIRGKNALGNVPAALEEMYYPELDEDSANDKQQMELF